MKDETSNPLGFGELPGSNQWGVSCPGADGV